MYQRPIILLAAAAVIVLGVVVLAAHPANTVDLLAGAAIDAGVALAILGDRHR